MGLNNIKYGGKGVAVRRAAGDSAVLARGARVPRQVPVLVPRRRAERGAAQRRARRRGVDGRVGRVLLRHEPRFDTLLRDTNVLHWFPDLWLLILDMFFL